MSVMWRYQIAFLSSFLGMFLHVYLLYGRGDWLQLPRLANALGAALIYAHIAGFVVLAARDVPALLMRWMNRTLAAIVGLLAAMSIATLAWWSHAGLFLLNSNPDWLVLLAGGVCHAVGLYLAASWHPARFILRVMRWMLAALCIFTPIAITYLAYQSSAQTTQVLLYFRDRQQMFVIGSLFALLVAAGGQVPTRSANSVSPEDAHGS